MPNRDVQIQLDLKIPMCDGVRLYAALYCPPKGDSFPVLLIRSPYSTQHPRYVNWAMRFAQHGYAVVMQDSRGRYESDGVWRPYIDETKDGYDTQQWIGGQPWCDGNIGTFGVSYPGFTQILPAPLRSPYVKALVPIANQEDNYGHMRYNGVLQLQNAMNFIWLGNRTNQNAPRNLIDWDNVYRRLPLFSALDDIGDRPFYREVIQHSTFDAFWKSYSMKGKYGEVEVPAYFITGWYDNLVHEGFKCFTGWKSQARTPEARAKTKLLVGPWPHNPIGTGEPFGDIGFGPNAGMDIPGVHLRWYDQRLKGIDTGIDDEPPIRIFVMGKNVWRDEHEWPLARTQWQQWHLHSGGHANTVLGDGELAIDPPQDETADRFTYDPEFPVQTMGGNNCCSPHIVPWGPYDQRPVEMRNDVLCYTSSPLEADLEVTGPIKLVLYAATEAPDTDWTGKLVDVAPDGYAKNLCDGILRARYRNSFTDPQMLEPNKVYQFEIDLGVTGNVFLKGHCIRLEISSSNFPRFDRNPNTGHPFGSDAELHPAQQTIYHTSAHPSHILLPVIPA